MLKNTITRGIASKPSSTALRLSQASSVARLPRRLSRSQSSVICRSSLRNHPSSCTIIIPNSRALHGSVSRSIDVTEDADKQEVKESEAHERPMTPTPISEEQYHERADAMIESLLGKLEELQDDKQDMDVDYSAGVLNVVFPPAGTYVLNKQPPNKQIWLSSPISGPKRFDYVVTGEAMNQKEGSGSDEWIYMRDGTTLKSLLRKELGVDLDVEHM